MNKNFVDTICGHPFVAFKHFKNVGLWLNIKENNIFLFRFIHSYDYGYYCGGVLALTKDQVIVYNNLNKFYKKTDTQMRLLRLYSEQVEEISSFWTKERLQMLLEEFKQLKQAIEAKNERNEKKWRSRILRRRKD